MAYKVKSSEALIGYYLRFFLSCKLLVKSEVIPIILISIQAPRSDGWIQYRIMGKIKADPTA